MSKQATKGEEQWSEDVVVRAGVDGVVVAVLVFLLSYFWVPRMTIHKD